MRSVLAIREEDYLLVCVTESDVTDVSTVTFCSDTVSMV